MLRCGGLPSVGQRFGRGSSATGCVNSSLKAGRSGWVSSARRLRLSEALLSTRCGTQVAEFDAPDLSFNGAASGSPPDHAACAEVQVVKTSGRRIGVVERVCASAQAAHRL